MFEEALQIAEKRRDVRGKEEKERYSQMNVEFQRIARRVKKVFPNDQCKQIEVNYRMGKTRDLFKKIRDTKGTFHAKMGSIKDRNGMDLTEAEDIKKRWQEYTEELHKKDFHDTGIEPGLLHCRQMLYCLSHQVGLECQKNYTKKDLNDSDNHNGVIIHLELDILE